jgi:hypothetical protein
LLRCGFTKPPVSIKLEDKGVIVQAISLHQSILQCKAEIDQFADGLKSLGVLSAIRRHPDQFKKFYCIDPFKKLTSGIIIMAFHHMYAQCN